MAALPDPAPPAGATTVPPASTAPGLRRTLLRWLLGPLLALLALDTALGWWSATRAADLAYDRSLLEIARELSLHVHTSPAGPRLELSEAAARILLVEEDDRLHFRVATAGGAVLGGEVAMHAPPPAAAPAGASVTPGGLAAAPRAAPAFYRAELRGEAVRVVAVWLPVQESASGERVLVQVGETLNRRYALAQGILLQALLPQLLLIALAAAVVWMGVTHGLAPLLRLQQVFASRSHRDLRPVPLAGVPAEAQPLVQEVNQLMARLEQALEGQSRFIADAAHQLKTPVSGLKAQIELAMRESDPVRLHHGLAQLYVGVERLSRLVRQLLALARNEPGAAQGLRLQPLDLAAFALEIAMEWAPQAIQRGVDLGFEGAHSGLMIDADAERLRDLVNNLIDNAVRYSRAGGRVTVAVASAEGTQARLWVSDDGPHIPISERALVFERFHRVLGTGVEGSGLGLAIVHEIAASHGARVTLEEDIDGVGNTFSVWFALLPDSGRAPDVSVS